MNSSRSETVSTNGGWYATRTELESQPGSWSSILAVTSSRLSQGTILKIILERDDPRRKYWEHTSQCLLEHASTFVGGLRQVYTVYRSSPLEWLVHSVDWYLSLRNISLVSNGLITIRSTHIWEGISLRVSNAVCSPNISTSRGEIPGCSRGSCSHLLQPYGISVRAWRACLSRSMNQVSVARNCGHRFECSWGHVPGNHMPIVP